MSAHTPSFMPSFAQAAALVYDLAQAAHLHIVGHIGARNDLCALLHCSLCLHLERLEAEDPAKMAAVINLLRTTVAQYDGQHAETGAANPTGSA